MHSVVFPSIRNANTSIPTTSGDDPWPWFYRDLHGDERHACCGRVRPWRQNSSNALARQSTVLPWLWSSVDDLDESFPPLHGDPGLRFRRSFLSRGLSGAGAWSIARLARPCVWSILLRVSRADDDFFFLLSSIQRSDEDWRLLAVFSSSITSTDKNCSQTKKKRPCKRSSRLSGGLLVSDFFQSEKPRSLDDQRHRSDVDGLRWANRNKIVSQSLKWKRGPFSHVPLMAQDFDRRSNPNCPFNHAQANLTTHEDRRRLHEKFFVPGVNNRRLPSPKTKPCEKLKKSFLFAFGHSLSFPSFFLIFSRFTVALSNSKQTWPRARKNWKSPDVQKLALVSPLARLVPPLAQVGFANLLLFVTLPIFFLERSFLQQNKAWRLGFSKHPPKRKFPHRNDL